MKTVNLEFELGKELREGTSTKEVKENFEKLFNGTNATIIATDHGVAVLGAGGSLLSMLSAIINQMYNEAHMPRGLVEKAIELGFEGIDEAEKPKLENIEELTSMLEKLKNLLK